MDSEVKAIQQELPRWQVEYDVQDDLYRARQPGDGGIAVEGTTAEQVVERSRALVRVQEVARAVLGDSAADLLSSDRWPETRRALTAMRTTQPVAPGGRTARSKPSPPPRTPPKPQAVPSGEPGAGDFTRLGEECGVCGRMTVQRETACRTRCMSCGAIEGGCA